MNRRRWMLAGVVAIVAMVLLLNPHWYLPPIGDWLTLPADTLTRHDNEAVVVLGGGGQQRLLQGIALLDGQPNTQVWYTGNMIPETGRSFIDPVYARTYAIRLGVAEERIYLLHSTSTWEDALAVKEQVQESGITHLIIVTNYFHSRRAMCVLRHHLADDGVTLLYSPPFSDEFDPKHWWQNEQDIVDVSEEWLKVMLYWYQYGLVPWDC